MLLPLGHFSPTFFNPKAKYSSNSSLYVRVRSERRKGKVGTEQDFDMYGLDSLVESTRM